VVGGGLRAPLPANERLPLTIIPLELANHQEGTNYQIRAYSRGFSTPNALPTAPFDPADAYDILELQEGEVLTNGCGAASPTVQTCNQPENTVEIISNDWYCTNRPNISTPLDIALPVAPGGAGPQFSNIEVGFTTSQEDGTMYSHTTDVYLNSQPIGYTTIQEGKRTANFSVPPEALTSFVSGASANTLSLRSIHNNSAHYSVGGEFYLRFSHSAYTSQQCSVASVAPATTPDCAVGGGIIQEPKAPKLTLNLALDDASLDPNNLQVGDLIPIAATVRNGGSADTTGNLVVNLRVPDGLTPVTAQLNEGTPLDFIDLGVWGDLFGGIFTEILQLLSGQELLLTTDAQDGVNMALTYTGVIPAYAEQTMTFALEVQPEFGGVFVIEGQFSEPLLQPSSFRSAPPQSAPTTQNIAPINSAEDDAMGDFIRLVLQIRDGALQGGECFTSLTIRLRTSPDATVDNNIFMNIYSGFLYLNGRYAAPDGVWYRVSGIMNNRVRQNVTLWIRPPAGENACNQNITGQKPVNGTVDDLVSLDFISLTPTPVPSATPAPIASPTPLGTLPAPTATPNPNATQEPQTLAEKLLVLERDYGVLLRYEGQTISDDYTWVNSDDPYRWTDAEIDEIYAGVTTTAAAFGLLSDRPESAPELFKIIMTQGDVLPYIVVYKGAIDTQGEPNVGFEIPHPNDENAPDLFISFYKEINNGGCVANQGTGTTEIIENANPRVVFCNAVSTSQFLSGNTFTQHTVVHELGHIFTNRTIYDNNASGLLFIALDGTTRGSCPELFVSLGFGDQSICTAVRDARLSRGVVMGIVSGVWRRGTRGWGTSGSGFTTFQQNPLNDVDEAAADMFLNWAYRLTTSTDDNSDGVVDTWEGFANIDGVGTYDPTLPGNARFDWMNIVMNRIFTLKGWSLE
jgi:hypothetical protein